MTDTATDFWSDELRYEDTSSAIVPTAVWAPTKVWGEEQHLEGLGRLAYPRLMGRAHALSAIEHGHMAFYTFVAHELAGTMDIEAVDLPYQIQTTSKDEVGLRMFLETLIDEAVSEALILTKAGRIDTENWMALFADPDPQRIQNSWREDLARIRSREDEDFEMPGLNPDDD